MAIKLVVFDMAGTTVEDKDNVHESFISAFGKNNFTINREDANSVMGITKPVAIRTLLEGKFKLSDTDALVSKIYTDFENEMIAFYRTDESVKAKQNAEKIFSALKERGIKVCIDTGFARSITNVIIERLGWDKKNLIDYSVTSDEVANGRPHADMIFKAMNALQISSANEVAKVGDTISDLGEGNSAKCKFVIGITTGAYTRHELEKEKHTHLIDDLLEVLQIIETETD